MLQPSKIGVSLLGSDSWSGRSQRKWALMQNSKSSLPGLTEVLWYSTLNTVTQLKYATESCLISTATHAVTSTTWNRKPVVKRHEQWTKLDNEGKESQTRAHELILRLQYGWLALAVPNESQHNTWMKRSWGNRLNLDPSLFGLKPICVQTSEI